MMIQLIDQTSRALAAAALLSVLVLTAPTGASATQLAQATPTPDQPSAGQPGTSAQPTVRAPRKAARANRPESVEARIADLHTKLHITPDESAQWDAVAQVMRDNAKAMETLMLHRSQNLKTMTALDDLQSYREINQAHVDGVNKLIPAFETLYNAMSPDQKKNADMVFGQMQRRASSGRS